MKYDELLQKVGNLACFSTRFLAAGENLAQVRLQLARWVKDGRLVKVRKGIYTLAEPYRKVRPEKFCVANALKTPSYVSLQSALAWHGLIPEYVPVTTGVTTGRPQVLETPLGRFEYRHVSKSLFWGYKKVDMTQGQQAFIADGEKALLDLVYLTPGGDSEDYLAELRLQNLEKLRKETLRQYAQKTTSQKLKRAVRRIEAIIDEGEGAVL